MMHFNIEISFTIKSTTKPYDDEMVVMMVVVLMVMMRERIYCLNKYSAWDLSHNFIWKNV